MQIVLELSSENAINNNYYLLHSSHHTHELIESYKVAKFQQATLSASYRLDLHTCMQQLHAVRAMYLLPTLLQNIETYLRL